MTAINPGGLPETPFAVDGQFLRPSGGGNRVLPALRPFWGQMPNRRGYDIRPARTAYQHGVARMLVRRMYASQAYKSEAVHYRLDDPNHLTLAAWQFDELVATLTLNRDSSRGLLADERYATELARLRRPNRVVCEVSRLAVDPDFSSQHLLTSLFKAAYKYAMDIFSASDAVIEVNPRHARYYQRRLGFQQIGNLRQCLRFDAPALLLHQPLDDLTFQRV